MYKHTMTIDYEKINYLLAQSRQLEAYGETDLVQSLWKRIIELLSKAIDDHTEALSEFITDLPTPKTSTLSEPEDRLETMTRKELLVLWNDLRGKPHTIKSVYAKPVLISEIRRLRAKN